VASDRLIKRTNIHVALLHYPVLNKSGETIVSAVTPMDLHDISRAVRTYGVDQFFVVTPLKDQQKLVRSVIDHWTQGYGATYNPTRRKALETVRLTDTLEAAKLEIRSLDRVAPRVVVTSSREHPASVSFETLGGMLGDEKPHLLVFGTAWGLAPEVIQEADYCLRPIRGRTEYNHLSVRSAVTVVLDRLLGC
jgi:hypothetical protein